MPWRDLPSLSALRAFDATARHGSFAEAGRALNVTHAAVTQAVRGLEAELSVQLVRRAGRRVGLTEAGERLARALDEGFSTLSGGIAALRQTEARRILRVTTTTFIAETHVMPRLPEFWASHPGIEVALSPSPAQVDLVREGYDMAIRALAGTNEDPPELEMRHLARVPLLAVCAPSLVARHHGDPQAMPWIVDRTAIWENQQLSAAGLDPSRLDRVQLGSPHLELSAARQGLGAILSTEIVCRGDLETGRLVRLPLSGLPSLTYVCVLPRGLRRPAVEEFARWLASIF